jgi:hypothetical protein
MLERQLYKIAKKSIFHRSKLKLICAECGLQIHLKVLKDKFLLIFTKSFCKISEISNCTLDSKLLVSAAQLLGVPYHILWEFLKCFSIKISKFFLKFFHLELLNSSKKGYFFANFFKSSANGA